MRKGTLPNSLEDLVAEELLVAVPRNAWDGKAMVYVRTPSQGTLTAAMAAGVAAPTFVIPAQAATKPTTSPAN
jgi:hypothetical protein